MCKKKKIKRKINCADNCLLNLIYFIYIRIYYLFYIYIYIVLNEFFVHVMIIMYKLICHDLKSTDVYPLTLID